MREGGVDNAQCSGDCEQQASGACVAQRTGDELIAGASGCSHAARKRIASRRARRGGALCTPRPRSILCELDACVDSRVHRLSTERTAASGLIRGGAGVHGDVVVVGDVVAACAAALGHAAVGAVALSMEPAGGTESEPDRRGPRSLVTSRERGGGAVSDTIVHPGQGYCSRGNRR